MSIIKDLINNFRVKKKEGGEKEKGKKRVLTKEVNATVQSIAEDLKQTMDVFIATLNEIAGEESETVEMEEDKEDDKDKEDEMDKEQVQNLANVLSKIDGNLETMSKELGELKGKVEKGNEAPQPVVIKETQSPGESAVVKELTAQIEGLAKNQKDMEDALEGILKGLGVTGVLKEKKKEQEKPQNGSVDKETLRAMLLDVVKEASGAGGNNQHPWGSPNSFAWMPDGGSVSKSMQILREKQNAANQKQAGFEKIARAMQYPVGN